MNDYHQSIKCYGQYYDSTKHAEVFVYVIATENSHSLLLLAILKKDFLC